MNTRRKVVAATTLGALFVAAWLLPDAAASEGAREPALPTAEMNVRATRIDWLLLVDYERLVLTVAGPKDLYIHQEFGAGQPPSLELFDSRGNPLRTGPTPMSFGSRHARKLRPACP